MQAFKHVLVLTSTGKGEDLKGVGNLILSNGFRILAFIFLYISENVQNMVQIAFFCAKSRLAAGGKPPTVIR